MPNDIEFPNTANLYMSSVHSAAIAQPAGRLGEQLHRKDGNMLASGNTMIFRRFVQLCLLLLTLAAGACDPFAGAEVTLLTNRVPLATPTDLAELRLGVPGAGFIEGAATLHYRIFSLEFTDGDRVVLNFDVTRSTTFGPVDERIEMAQRFEGKMTGTLSADEQTITWHDVEGTLSVVSDAGSIQETQTTPLGVSDPLAGPAQPGDMDLGTWTRTAIPAPPLDGDGDDVADEFDQCSDSTAGEVVDKKGCTAGQRDSDADGVTDDRDQCSHTLPSAEVDERGCALSQLDGDSDGVSDADDECPGSPRAAPVDVSGCEVESPGPIAESWRVESDPLFAPGSVAVYDLTADGILNQAQMAIMDELFEAPPEITVTLLADTVPYRVATDILAVSVDEVGLGFESFDLNLRYDHFAVTFDEDGTVTWAFDVTQTTGNSIFGIKIEQRERLVGTMIGSLSDDGDTITWESVTGMQTNTTNSMLMDDEEFDGGFPLEDRFLFVDLGTWTRID